jgi:hypothetical protein
MTINFIEYSSLFDENIKKMFSLCFAGGDPAILDISLTKRNIIIAIEEDILLGFLAYGQIMDFDDYIKRISENKYTFTSSLDSIHKMLLKRGNPSSGVEYFDTSLDWRVSGMDNLVSAVAVDENRRREGIASRLIAADLHNAKLRGSRMSYAQCRDNSRELFRNQGYEWLARIEHGYPDGSAMTYAGKEL